MNKAKLLTLTFFAGAVAAMAALGEAPPAVRAVVQDDPAAVYKAKCAMCHTPKAEKFFDPAKAEEELVQVILKGKKGEKPPFMPGYEEKGMTPDQAKALTQYMVGLRTPK
jgi:mono/diheme cytochrome c family protein